MIRSVSRLAAILSLLLPLATYAFGHGAGDSTSQVLAPGARFRTWELLAKLAANASSDQALVTPEELAEQWEPDALRAISLYQSLPHGARRGLMRSVAELQLMGDTPASSLQRLQRLLDAGAASEGDSTAQFLLAALAEQEGSDPARTVLLYEFASRGGSLPATMALGYRYQHGYNVPRSCDAAAQHYRHAADRVIAEEAPRGSLLPSQMFALPEPVRLSDNHHDGDHRTGPQRDQEDVGRAEYLRHRALASRNPELLERSASIVLFTDLYCSPASSWLLESDGDALSTCASRGREAVAFLHEAAETGSYSARALLGHVYAFSLAGVEQNVSRAVDLYQEALAKSRAAGTIAAEAANGLGLVYSYGLGDALEPDPKEAMALFKVAADAGLADGVYNMAVMMSDAYPAHAKSYLVAAADVGHLHSLYELARLKDRELKAASGLVDTTTACNEVVSLYKRVAEHSAELRRVMDLALVLFNAGATDGAQRLYRIAAEMGSEVAQSNALWVMERSWAWSMSPRSSRDTGREYLRLVQRAADQDSPDAYIRLGDWEFARGKHVAALKYYSEADDLSHGASGRALYSIGYMHEHGLGGAMQSLERAELYYLFAGDAERVMWYPMAALRLKLKAQRIAARLLSLLECGWSTVRGRWEKKTATVADQSSQEQDQLEGVASKDELSKTADASAVGTNHPDEAATDAAVSVSPASLEFAAALEFAGDDSQLDVELATPILGIDFQDFTVESWVFIAALRDSKAPEEGDRRPMMVVDALDNFQLELVPDSRGARSWQLRFRKFSLARPNHPDVSVVFVNAPLVSERWLHLALTFDARTQTVALYVDGKACGQYALQPRRFSELSDELVAVDASAASRLVAIGSSLSRHVHAAKAVAFWGQLVRFRVWRSRMLPDQVQRLMTTADASDRARTTASAREQLAIDLRYHMLGSATDGGEPTGGVHVLNGDQFVPSARGVRLRMVPFPPTAAK